MMLQAQWWYKHLEARSQQELFTMLQMAHMGNPQEQLARGVAFWGKVYEHYPQQARAYTCYRQATRPDGMIAALLGEEFLVNVECVGFPAGTPRDGRQDQVENFIRKGASRTYLDEAPRWLGGLCIHCELLLIDGFCKIHNCWTHKPATN